MTYFKRFLTILVLSLTMLANTTTAAQAQSNLGTEIFSIGRDNNLNQNFNALIPRSNNPENTSPIHNSSYTETEAIQVNATIWSSSYHLRVVRETSQTLESTACNSQELADANNQGYNRCGFAFNQFVNSPSMFNNSLIAQLNPVVLGGGGSYWLIIGSGQKNADSSLDPRIKINVNHNNSSQNTSSSVSNSQVSSSSSSQSSTPQPVSSSSVASTSQSSNNSSSAIQSSILSSISSNQNNANSASSTLSSSRQSNVTTPDSPEQDSTLELPKVSNFSLEENDRSITVRWPATAGADGYKIFVGANTSSLLSSPPIVIKGCPNPINGTNTINSCQFKISNLINTELRYIDLLATFGNEDGPVTDQPKSAVPYQVVIDDDAQYSQGCEVESAVCLFTPYEPYRRWSSNRGQAPYKTDLQYNAVGEDSYDVITGEGYPNKGIWQSGQKLNGTYDVLVKYILYPENATDVNYTIGANSNIPLPVSGSTLEVPINQRTSQGLGYNGLTSGWIRLGSYRFNNILGVISLDGNSDSGRIVMDAVAFQQIAPTPFPPVTTFSLTKTIADLNGGLTLSGETVRYTIGITNNSQSSVNNIQITDAIPVFVTLDPSSIVITSGGIFDTDSSVFNANYSTLAAGSSIQITFNAVIKPNLLPKTVITNFVSVITGNAGSSSASADIVIDVLESSSSQSSSQNSNSSNGTNSSSNSSSAPLSQSSSSTTSVSSISSESPSSSTQSSSQNNSSTSQNSISSQKSSKPSSSTPLGYGGAVSDPDGDNSSDNSLVAKVTVRTGGKLPNVFGGVATLSLLLITLTMLVRITVGKGL